MEKSKFDAAFPIICSALVEQIIVELDLSDKEGVTNLYSSHLYEMLEQEETKVWQYSTKNYLNFF